MKGKHKCKKKREDAPQGEHLATMNAGKEQKHTGEEDSKAKTDKSENPMNNVSKWWNDPAHVIQSAGIGIGVIVAIIYGCQLSQMVKSNKISRESLQSAQRAFVSFKSIVSARGNESWCEKGKHYWEFSPQFENLGSTPALSAVNHVGVAILTYEPDDAAFEKVDPSTFVWETIGPRAEIQVATSQAAKEDDILGKDYGETMPILHEGTHIPLNIPNSRMLFVWGWVAYRDVFNGTKPHLTEFCQRLMGIAQFGDRHVETFVGCGKHNCTDEYCGNYQEIIRAFNKAENH
jgi:hypothetical protein